MTPLADFAVPLTPIVPTASMRTIREVPKDRARSFVSAVRLLLVIGFGCANVAVPVAAQRSASTRPRDLAELTRRAAVIVHGVVVGARVEPHPQFAHLRTVVVTVRVGKVLKGSADELFSFRQFIWDPRDAREAAGYRRGEELLLLLNAPSRFGLSSPVGLDQGRFRVLRPAGGVPVAVNDRGNVGLFDTTASDSALRSSLSPGTARTVANHRAGAVPVEQLEEVIRAGALR